jgi:hypothetical protein
VAVAGIGVPMVLLGVLMWGLAARESWRARALESEARAAIVRLADSIESRERLFEQQRLLGAYAGLLQDCQEQQEAMAITARYIEQLLPQAAGRCFESARSSTSSRTAVSVDGGHLVRPPLPPLRTSGIRMKQLVLLAALLSPTADAADLVGTTIPPTPAGLVHKQGACIAGSALGMDRICAYSIGILEEPDGTPKILHGAREAGHSVDGKPLWTITDAMPYPSLPAGYALRISTCERDGKADETVFAAARITDDEWYEDVLWARRYDIAAEKFVEVPSAGVRCLNEGWGL